MGKKRKKKKGARGKGSHSRAKAPPSQAEASPSLEQAPPTLVKSSIKEEPPKRKREKRPSAPRKREQPNWLLLALAGAGMVLTGYLLISSWMEGELLFCAEGSTCDIVQKSRWGEFLGLPTALWGFAAYASLAYVALRVRNPEWHWKAGWVISLVGLGHSIYLTAISILVLEATCGYCLASLTLLAIIFIVVVFQRPEGLSSFSYPSWAVQTIVLAAVVVGGMHLHYSGLFDPAAGPEDPYLKGLAEHLTKSEALFYGAYW